MPRKKGSVNRPKAKDRTQPREEKQDKKNKRFSRLRGMRDVLFDEAKYWELVERKARDLARAFGFNRIDTPILESLSLYERSTGKDTDIVSKEMYNFIDKNGDKVALRPELTPGMVRAYIEHGMFNLPQPVKTFSMGPVFRHEKPQSGRYRQHSQFNLDVFGEESPVADFMLILVAYNFFRELQIDTQVQINSIGCKDCRQEYLRKLLEFYKERGKKTKLCNDCKRRIVKNPLRLLDCKEPGCQEVREGAPQIIDYLCEPCKNHFIKVLEYLDEMDIPYNLNSLLVRGLDYYNRTVFEFWAINEGEDGAQDKTSLGGGGRYDGLIEYMGGRPTPAVGFGLGLERTIMKIKEKNIPLRQDTGNVIFLAQLGEQARVKVINLFEEMRRSGFKVRQSFVKDSLKAQLEEANRVGAKLSLIAGQKEVMDGTIILRDMESGVQEVIDFKKVIPEVEKRLASSESKSEKK